jgi:ribose-phosphate pyrophosphokinase
MIVLGKDEFSEKLAEELRSKFVKLDYKLFPDKESYLRITEPNIMKGEDVVFVCRGKTPGFSSDKLLTESLIMTEKLKELGVKRICLVLPYMPYARQDKEFLKGEAVSLRSLRNLLKERTDMIINVAAHDHREEGWIEDKIYNIDPTDSVYEFFKDKKFKDLVVIAPDMTADKNVEKLAELLDARFVAVNKERDKVTGETRTEDVDFDFGGKEVMIYDDIISTGGTILGAIHSVKMHTPRKIVVVAIHTIISLNEKFKGTSLDLIKETGAELYSSDTIDSPVSKISIVPQLAKTIGEKF